jgi:hypothetical protein
MCSLGPIRPGWKDEYTSRKRPRGGDVPKAVDSGGFPVFSLAMQGQLLPDLTAHSMQLSAALRMERACVISFDPALADELDSAYASLFTATEGALACM